MDKKYKITAEKNERKNKKRLEVCRKIEMLKSIIREIKCLSNKKKHTIKIKKKRE